MTAIQRRQRRIKRATVAAVLAALVVHVTLVASVEAFGLGFVGRGFDPTALVPRAPEDEVVDLQTTCAGDAALAATARTALCLAPWRNGDLETCTNDVQMNLWMDLSGCQARNTPSAAVAMLEPNQADKLKAIDPEPLLDELKQQEPPPPPPPVQLQPQAPQPPPPPPPPAPSRPAQVVETAKPNTETEPVNARFLSEYNVSVDKQTVARGSANEPMVAKSKPADLTPKNDPKEAAMKPELLERDPGKDKRAPDVPGSLAMRTPGVPAPSEVPQDAKTRGQVTGAKGPLLADGFVPRQGDGALEQQRRDPGELARGQGGAGGGTPQVPNLKPSADVLERALGGGNVDHLDDVQEGEETALSSKRWVFASFFNRMKRQVAQNWDPQTVWRRNDPQGTVYGFKTRITEVRVSLSAKGELAKVVVTQPSGVSELDDEAVRAFHAAAPLPNPPDGLVAKDNLITFAFSFYFEIGAPRTSWRVIRSM